MKRQTTAPTLCCSKQSAVLRSDDGIIEFRLSSIESGVYVERLQKHPGTARTILATVFTEDSSFSRWCDADAMRFDYPLIYVALKRNGHALFGKSG
jgi:hypothetical protein